MNKNLILIIVVAIIVGILVENQLQVFPSLSSPESSMIDLSQNTSLRQGQASRWRKDFEVVEIKSPLDGSLQPAYFYKTKSDKPQPLIVSLHSWSHDYTQYDSINEFSFEKDFNFIHPNFRGVNNTKDGCCSDLVISDIDASIDYALKNANVDKDKIYVMGMSGGGYATLGMFMKSKHKIKKFSAWVPLVDLVQWYKETKMLRLKYTPEILACTNSMDGVLNAEIAKQKSPIYWKTPVNKLKYATLEINTGIYDGLGGNNVIPITHSINFYNKLLTDLKIKDSSKYVSPMEKLSLLEFREPLGDFGEISGREVMLVKQTDRIKLTLFEGGHEMLEKYAFEQLIK